jgi:hypothetical protein
MRKKQFLLCLGLFAILLYSCDELQVEIGGGSGSGGGSGNVNKPNVPSRKFWAQNTVNNSYYQVEADLLAESKNCRVWAEKGAGVSDAMAISMVKAYEEKIRPKMLDTFSYNGQVGYNGRDIGPIDKISNGVVVANNTLELAGWMTNDDEKKLTILLLDIKDSYKPRENEAYVAGYFWMGNILGNDPSHPQLRYSNGCSMIYVDTNPGVPGSEYSNQTVAHELQHLMSFVNYFISNRETILDTWIDEGLSSAAEWLYFGEQVKSKIIDYSNDWSGLIKKGNNFFVWGNRESESQYANLDDYSTVYLFFQWLRLQSGSTRIYNDIIMSQNYDYTAVTEAADRAMGGNGYSNWETLLKTWLAANYINAPSGPYGYSNDETLKNIRAKTMPTGVKNVSLAPGEGVYSLTNNFAIPPNKQSIRYAGLNKADNTLSDTATFTGGALLTYNANTNLKGGAETGTTTGVAASVEAGIDGSSRSAVGEGFSGPYAIGFGDMLRQNGFEIKPFYELALPIKGIAILE